MSPPAVALDHQVGFSGGTAFLYGDNTTSEAGPSLGFTYEMIFNPVLGMGVESTYQRIRGESRISNPTSIFYGPHNYDTTFLMLGLFNRFRIPTRIVQPNLSLGFGATLWFPGDAGDVKSLPLKRKISWSTTPFVSIGTGIGVQLGRNWGIDIGAKGMYFFSDALDNTDGHYVTGRSSRNDYTIQSGITIVYRFGGESETRREIVPGNIPFEPEPPVPQEIIPDEIVPESYDYEDIIPQEPVFETVAPEADSTAGDSGESISPGMGAPDTPDISPTPPVQPPIPQAPPRMRTPQQAAPPQVINRVFLVHVASYSTIDEASRQVDMLNETGYLTRISSVDRGEIGIWFRVYVGPYTTRAEAERAADRLIQAGLSDYAAVIESEE